LEYDFRSHHVGLGQPQSLPLAGVFLLQSQARRALTLLFVPVPGVLRPSDHQAALNFQTYLVSFKFIKFPAFMFSGVKVVA
jgi:hypothetical protein